MSPTLFDVGFTIVCMAYFTMFYYLLVTGNSDNNYGMFALLGFFAIFMFLGLGGIEFILDRLDRMNKK